jgi:hypothetical protein
MTPPTLIQSIGAALFVIALIHTFSTVFFKHLAQRQPRHAGLWHLLGEVEIVFGFWAFVLIIGIFAFEGKEAATTYLDSRNYTEPLFVFVIMVIAATQPILKCAATLVKSLSKALSRVFSVNAGLVQYGLIMTLLPLLGSLITEPAAMTLAALMLRDSLFCKPISNTLKYATLGVLFVNVSIGGVLTPFAAPPVLMVASAWQWDMAFMLTHFGWRAAVAVVINSLGLMVIFRRSLSTAMEADADDSNAVLASEAPMPFVMVFMHILFLVGVIVFAHHTAVFMGIFLFFLGFTTAYPRHQTPLILREALLVSFFLGGLVVLGGQQQWWLQPLLLKMDDNAVFFGATALTAVTDNAALTYLASLVDGLTTTFKIALVAGAVTGGGLTVIANAPNPAGLSILRPSFDHQEVNPLKLLLSAALPTLVAMIAFRCLVP